MTLMDIKSRLNGDTDVDSIRNKKDDTGPRGYGHIFHQSSNLKIMVVIVHQESFRII